MRACILRTGGTSWLIASLEVLGTTLCKNNRIGNKIETSRECLYDCPDGSAQNRQAPHFKFASSQCQPMAMVICIVGDPFSPDKATSRCPSWMRRTAHPCDHQWLHRRPLLSNLPWAPKHMVISEYPGSK